MYSTPLTAQVSSAISGKGCPMSLDSLERRSRVWAVIPGFYPRSCTLDRAEDHHLIALLPSP